MKIASKTADRRLEVGRGADGMIVLVSLGGGMPVAIRMTDAETLAVIDALAAEAKEGTPHRTDPGRIDT